MVCRVQYPADHDNGIECRPQLPLLVIGFVQYLYEKSPVGVEQDTPGPTDDADGISSAACQTLTALSSLQLSPGTWGDSITGVTAATASLQSKRFAWRHRSLLQNSTGNECNPIQPAAN